MKKIDPLEPFKAAWSALSQKLADYKEIVAELEDFRGKKAITEAAAEAEVELSKLDALCIRLRSLELRERSVSQKALASEEALQAALPLHIERDQRLAGYWGEKLLATAFSELRAHFPPSFADEGALRQLAPKTARYVDGRISVPALSFAWTRPLANLGFTQKVMPPDLQIADAIYSAPQRSDIVGALLAAAQDVLATEEKLFAVLAGQTSIPSFEVPTPTIEQQIRPEFNQDVNYRPPSAEDRLREAQESLNQMIA